MTIMREVIADIDPDLVGQEVMTIAITAVDNPPRVSMNCEDMTTDIVHQSDTLDRDLTMTKSYTDILLIDKLSNLPHSRGTNRIDQSTMRNNTKTNVTFSLRHTTKIKYIAMNGLIIRLKIVTMGIKNTILWITTSLA